jgi:hypothetical protein
VLLSKQCLVELLVLVAPFQNLEIRSVDGHLGHLLFAVGFKSLYGMFTVRFYAKVRNDFVLGHNLTSFERVTHESTKTIETAKMSHANTNISPIVIEFFRIVGETCNFPLASLGREKMF